ncbi:MAG TPA: glycosyltransferase family A protein [Oligoflexia bacterium]|nr:glycosyltransferase family A protein [Oligoflexia bacterium]HMP48821.1 glycosyltransferase family A protein [Oligoflexia bacterium]
MSKFSCSVIIPTYNREQITERALQSVFKQTAQPSQIILVNDGSTEPYNNIINISKQRGVDYFKTKHSGVSAARNSGLRKASGEWICFLDSDDEWLPEKLEKQLEYISNNRGALFVQSLEKWIKGDKEVSIPKHLIPASGPAFARSLDLCCISASTCMIHHSLVDKVGFFDERLLVCEDYDYWLRALTFTDIHLIGIPLSIKYNSTANQLSDSEIAIDRFRVFSLLKYLSIENFPENNKKLALSKLIEKLDILITGARKRGLERDYLLYEMLLMNVNKSAIKQTGSWIDLLDIAIPILEHKPKF